ncbi:flagellar basal body rod protein FlgB [Candidatus Thiodiazotropha sp. CDECU1]|uniref:flagellar basal body rod protein FlgB n=1 Tax=Candidatus Thiodiazotropha sp. CDECU1 TaxID=3065865 RepID=UPI00292DFDD8|nr:flagellar basal body rod protein FlgB [Candidatus Thiodiazotropha sp. CDECU1]
MIDDIGGVTSRLVSLALDVSSQRQQVIAHNIANADTPGFSPQKVSFEQLLEKANLLTSDQPASRELVSEIDRLQQRLHRGELIEASEDETVSLDMEMVKLTENVLHYRAMLEGLAKRGSLIKLAITEGK